MVIWLCWLTIYRKPNLVYVQITFIFSFSISVIFIYWNPKETREEEDPNGINYVVAFSLMWNSFNDKFDSAFSFWDRGSVRSENRQTTIANLHQPTGCSTREEGIYGFPNKSLICSLLCRCYSSSQWSSSRMFSFTACKAYSGEASSENDAAVAKIHNHEIEFNRVNCLVWVLHESARSFSVAIESLGLTGSSPGIAMAWSGKDIHAWHKRISYQV